MPWWGWLFVAVGSFVGFGFIVWGGVIEHRGRQAELIRTDIRQRRANHTRVERVYLDGYSRDSAGGWVKR